MLKHRQSLKVLIKNGRSSVPVTADAAASASGHLLRPSLPEAEPLARLALDPLRSWRRWNRVTCGSCDVLGFRTISNQVMARTHLPIGHLDRWIGLLKVSLQRKPFNARQFLSFGRSFGSYSMLTPDGVVFGLIGVNVAVFVLWRIADPTFMRKNFMVSLDNFRSWRLHTLLTSAFSHCDADHILSNMIGFYFFGTSIATLFGPEFLLKLYIGGALGGSVFFLVHKAMTARSLKGKHGWDISRTPALGASAAVNSIILLYVCLFPKNVIYLNLIIPVPAILLGAILIGTDLWRVKEGDRISGSAHLGGAVVGALVFARIKGWI